MTLNKNVIYRNIAGEHVLIPVGSEVLEQNGMFVMTDLAAEIWQMLEKGKETETIIQELLEEYEVEEGVLRKDVEEFLQKLVTGKLIEL